MGICLEKLPHSCGSKSGLQVYVNEETKKVDGFCWSCNKYVANPYGKPVNSDEVELPKPKTEEEIQREIAEISGYPSVDVKSRKLRASDLDFLNIKIELNEEDGKTPMVAYCPVKKDGKHTGYYAKALWDKGGVWSLGDVKDADLIGWDEARSSGAYRLIITEGWLDACAVEKIYKLYGTDDDYHPAIVSLPNGTNSTKAISKVASDIKRLFKEVVFCFDDDKPGKNAVEKAMVILPTALSVTLPCNDANDCVIEGRMKAAYKALRFHSEKPKNTRLINMSDVFREAREPTPWGEYSWPFQKLNDALRGLRSGSVTYIGGPVKMGKSELLNACVANNIMNDGIDVFLAKPEEALKITAKRVAGKMVGGVFHDPKVEFDYEAYDKAAELVGKSIWTIDLYQHMGWDTLKMDIIAAAGQGCKVFYIDPITNLTAGMRASERDDFLHGVTREMKSMAQDLDIAIVLFCHLKAPDGNISKDNRLLKYKRGEYYNLGNCPHELGGDILSNQFTGSRAMMQSCDLMLGLAGNKDPDLPEEIQRMRWITILEDREFGNNGHIPIIWSPTTQLYTEC